jgi:prepilin-type N-terminal cleavage/methylation domain-containing protein
MKLRAQSSTATDSGFTILESLIAVVIIGLAAAASTSMLMVGLRALRETAQSNSVQAAIEANKDQIDQLARSFTCCSGICTTAPPGSGTFGGANQPCLTDNPNDDRYYFPRLDNPSTTTNITGTTTPSEPIAVDQLCLAANNTAFMTPLKNAIDGLAQPTPATRVAAFILDYKMLRVNFTDPSGVVVRSLYVKPRMANFCS